MIPRVETGLGKLNSWMRTATPIGSPSSQTSEVAKKSIGEVPPQIVEASKFPQLSAMLAQYGIISVLRRKLMTLSGQDARIVLAKNTVGAADNKGLVYLGVEFLQEMMHDPAFSAILAGVMAHEWGHLKSSLKKYGNLDQLTWDEIFEIRREEEAFADSFAGRNLPLMGYSVEPLVEFLMKDKDRLGSHKYFNPEIRASILRRAAQASQDRQNFSQKLFSKGVYANPYTSILLVA